MMLRRMVGAETVCINCADRLKNQADCLLDQITELSKTSIGIFDGCTIRFGWSLIALYRREDYLQAFEPDFDNNPFEDWRENLTCTLSVQARQVELLTLLGLEGAEVHFSEKFVFKRDAFDVRKVYLQRSKPISKGDSGWYMGPVDGLIYPPQEGELEAIYIYQLLQRKPELMRILPLPFDFVVVFNGGELEAIVDQNNRNLWTKEIKGKLLF